MKVAVTGASGFIGRHVLDALAAQGVEAVAVVRSAGTDVTGLSCAAVVPMDIRDVPSDPFGALGHPDALIHLAWGGLPNYRSLHHFEEELPAQYRFLKSIVLSGLKHLIVAGTCFEYGMQSGPLAVTAPTLPDNPYGYAKDALRRQMQFLNRTEPFRLAWARLFYLFGDGQPATALYSQLSAAVLRGDRAFPMSGGEQLRDYLPVDVVASRLAALALDEQREGVFNICSGAPVSIRSLAEGWVRSKGWDIELDFGRHPYPDYEPMAFWGIPNDGA